MKKFKIYDHKLRVKFKKKELDLLFLHLIYKNTTIPYLYKKNCNFYQLNKMDFFSKIQNICIVTGRSRSVYKIFKISRIMLRQLGSKGLILGLRKSS
jgi:small subunit ribosomal protein S14